MDEKDTVSQSQSSEPVKTSKWAKIALWCAGLGYLAPLVWFVLLIPLLLDVLSFDLGVLGIILIGTSILSIIASLVIGVFALIHISLSKGKIQGTRKAVTAVVLSLIYIFFVGVIIVPPIVKVQQSEHRRVCGEHLSALGKSLHAYAENYRVYPIPNQWCDILVKTDYATKGKLEWPRNQKAKCSYAINPNCEPNSTGDVVLLFETNGGWNTFGGAELLTIYNHQKGEGAFILYNDGHVTFDIADSNGHFNYELNWGEKGKGRDLK
jgi:hypothetical protein